MIYEAVLLQDFTQCFFLAETVRRSENVVHSVEDHSGDFAVRSSEHVNERLHSSLSEEHGDLLYGSGTRQVADGPASLLLGLRITILQEINEGREQVVIDHSLHLVFAPGGDV